MNNKDLQKKLLMKKTMASMNKQIAQLEEQKKIYIGAAKDAKRKGLNAQVNLAVSGLKMTMAQQKKAQEMLLNFQITSQMKDTAMMTKEFLRGMEVLSGEMNRLTSGKDFLRVQQQFEKAMSGVEEQSLQLDTFLECSSNDFSAAASPDNVSDAEIQRLLDDVLSGEGAEGDNGDLDSEIEALRKKIEA